MHLSSIGRGWSHAWYGIRKRYDQNYWIDPMQRAPNSHVLRHLAQGNLSFSQSLLQQRPSSHQNRRPTRSWWFHRERKHYISDPRFQWLQGEACPILATFDQACFWQWQPTPQDHHILQNQKGLRQSRKSSQMGQRPLKRREIRSQSYPRRQRAMGERRYLRQVQRANRKVLEIKHPDRHRCRL